MTKCRLPVLRHAERVTGHVARTCRYHGIARTTFYEWLRELRDRPSLPRRHASARSTEVAGQITHLRWVYPFGLRRIAAQLECC